MKKNIFQIALVTFALTLFFSACHDPNKATENNTDEKIQNQPPRRGDKNEIGLDSQRLGLDSQHLGLDTLQQGYK